MQVNRKIYPDFFIAGVQKCGSSSLAKWLEEHPDLVCSTPKEPKYFCDTRKVKQDEGFAELFAEQQIGNSNQLLFEASQIYSVDPVTIDNISKIYKQAPKFIFIVRDPVSRAISAYYHTVKHGTERRPIHDVFNPEFENLDQDELIFQEKEHIKQAAIEGKLCSTRYQKHYSDSLLPYRYMHGSLYRKNINVFEKKFGKDNVLTLPLSVFKINANKAFDDICDFLKVEKFLTYPDTSSRHNKTAIPFYRIPENQTINQSTLSYKAFNIAYQLSKKIRLDHFFLKDTPPTPDSVKKILENALSKEKSWLENLEKSF